MNAKRKAMEYYLKVVIEGLPLKYKNKALDLMLKEKQDLPTERLKETLDIAIQEAKKEVFDDIDNEVGGNDFWYVDSRIDRIYRKLKKRHLSEKKQLIGGKDE